MLSSVQRKFAIIILHLKISHTFSSFGCLAEMQCPMRSQPVKRDLILQYRCVKKIESGFRAAVTPPFLQSKGIAPHFFISDVGTGSTYAYFGPSIHIHIHTYITVLIEWQYRSVILLPIIFQIFFATFLNTLPFSRR